MSDRLDEQRSRYIDLLIAKALEHADDEPVRERYCDRIEAILRGPVAAPAPVAPKQHPSGLGWIDMASGHGVPSYTEERS